MYARLASVALGLLLLAATAAHGQVFDPTVFDSTVFDVGAGGTTYEASLTIAATSGFTASRTIVGVRALTIAATSSFTATRAIVGVRALTVAATSSFTAARAIVGVRALVLAGTASFTASRTFAAVRSQTVAAMAGFSASGSTGSAIVDAALTFAAVAGATMELTKFARSPAFIYLPIPIFVAPGGAPTFLYLPLNIFVWRSK